MAINQSLRRERKALGVCVSCGGMLDFPGVYVNCADCRQKSTAASKQWRAESAQRAKENEAERRQMEEKIRSEIAKDAQMRQVAICACCEWVKWAGHVLYCPFMEGICEKGKEMRERTGRADDHFERTCE